MFDQFTATLTIALNEAAMAALNFVEQVQYTALS